LLGYCTQRVYYYQDNIKPQQNIVETKRDELNNKDDNLFANFPSVLLDSYGVN